MGGNGGWDKQFGQNHANQKTQTGKWGHTNLCTRMRNK